MSIASEILKAAQERNQQRVMLTLMRGAALRSFSERHMTIKHRKCPACHEGLKIKVVEAAKQTHFYCPGCHAFKTFNTLLDEGVAFGDSYLPGVTGGLKGRRVLTLP